MTYRSFIHRLIVAVSFIGCSAAATAQAELDNGLVQIQRQWEQIQYQSPAAERADRLQKLTEQARLLVERYPNAAESQTWYGIVLSSYAAAKGGLGALSLVKQAKVAYEHAIALDSRALNGSATSSLGVLYYKVPGWPIGFGDNKRAGELLVKGLSYNPDGVDSNFFYADYLYETKRGAEALPYLAKALRAPKRPGREVADQGRLTEVAALRDRIVAEQQ